MLISHSANMCKPIADPSRHGHVLFILVVHSWIYCVLSFFFFPLNFHTYFALYQIFLLSQIHTHSSNFVLGLKHLMSDTFWVFPIQSDLDRFSTWFVWHQHFPQLMLRDSFPFGGLEGEVWLQGVSIKCHAMFLQCFQPQSHSHFLHSLHWS